METIYIEQENCTLHRCEDHLILKKQGKSLTTIPLINVDSIVLFSSVQITSQSLFKISIAAVFWSNLCCAASKIFVLRQ